MRKIGFKLALLAIGWLSVSSLQAQNCEPSENKKAIKLLDKATSSSSMELGERRVLLKDALEVDENCLECRFALARLEYQMASEQNRSYDPSLANFQGVIDQCPTYHADAYYYSGIIHYGNQDYNEAQKALEAFITFDPELGSISRDNERKIEDVESILPEVSFYANFYDNPVAYSPVRQDGVSGNGDEYLPMLSPDNEYIFFTRKESVKAKGDLYSREVENFMRGSLNKSNNNYETPKPLEPPFNVGDNYGGVSISLDNREMFITVCKPVGGNRKNCDIYRSVYEYYTDETGNQKMRWSGLENLGPNVNSDGWEAQPTLSADGNTLYFATSREESIQDENGNYTIDIYSTTRQPDGSWSKAVGLGNPINTDGNDKSPFLHVDSRTMYFSSNGHLGAGGYDIFFCKQNEDGTWSEPKNIGYPINSPQDEHGLIVSTDGARAFFASSNIQSSRGLDIYAFELPQKAKPEKVLLLKGDATNEKGDVIKGARIELKYAKSKEIEEIEVDKVDGSYAAVVNLRPDEEVMMSVKSDEEELAFNTRMFTIADTVNTVQDLDMEVENVKEGKTYRINDIRFPTGSADIDESSKQVLLEFADYLNENKSLAIEIGGHTDDVGNADSNLALSTERAFKVFGFLQEAGVSGSRMTYKGYGQTKPVVPNSSEENRAKNRRTEFKINRL